MIIAMRVTFNRVDQIVVTHVLELEVVLATAVALVYQIARGVVHLCRFRLRHFQRDTRCPLRGLPPTHSLVRLAPAELDVVQIM
jgi:hypothetical protein